MEISVCVLDYLLGGRFRILHKGTYQKDRTFQYISPLYGHTADEKESVLYVTIKEVCPEEEAEHPHQLLLQITCCEPADPDPGWFLICKPGEEQEAVQYILKEFTDYLTWYGRMENLCECKRDCRSMLSESERFLQIYTLLMNENLNIMYSSQEYFDAFHKFFSSDIRLRFDQGFEEMFDLDHTFDETFHTEGLTDYTPLSLIDGHRSLYANIWFNHTFSGRFICEYDESRDPSGARELIASLFHWIYSCWLYIPKNISLTDSLKKIEEFIPQLLEGSIPSTPQFEDTLRFWNNHNYGLCILAVTSTGHIQSPAGLALLSSELGKHLPYSIVFTHNGSIVALNLCEHGTEFQMPQTLPEFLRDNMLKGGLSMQSANLTDIRDCYEQALAVLETGVRVDPDFWLFSFSDYIADCCLSEAYARFRKENLCPTVIRTLRSYDKTHTGSELEQTLKTYCLSRFNGSTAAQKLHIHRTTFFYRLSKIQELTNLNLDNLSELLSLLICFYGENAKN